MTTARKAKPAKSKSIDTTELSDLLTPSPDLVRLCVEFLRRDRLWREMSRPTEATPFPEAMAMHNRITKEWHFGGQALVQIQDSARPLVKLRHVDPKNPTSPMVTRVHWECESVRFQYDFRGNRLTFRKAN